MQLIRFIFIRIKKILLNYFWRREVNFEQFGIYFKILKMLFLT